MTSEPASEPSVPAAQPTPPPVAPPKSSGGTAAVTVIMVLLVAIAAAATFPLWRDQAGFPAPATFNPDSLRAELAATNARLALLEARPAAAAPSGDSGLNGRVAALEQTIRTLQSQPPAPAHLAAEVDSMSKQVADLRRSAADAATVLRLADRIERAEAALRDLQSRRSSAAALLLAVGQLREAVALGRPFDAELRAVKALAGDDAEVAGAIETVAAQAAAGIATRAALADRFEALAPRIIRAEILPEGEGWWRRVVDRVLSLVVIRREDGTVAGGGTAATVARASAAVARNDFAVASAELDALTGGPAELAAPWSGEAKTRLAADRTLSGLAAHAIAITGAATAKVGP